MSSESTKQIDMSGIRLKPDISIGCCQISRANTLPLTEIFVCLSQSEVWITFWGNTKAPWDGITLVNIFMYKYPHGRKEFESKVKFFSDRRKQRARLPEGIPFDENVLAVKNVPLSWEHSAFARSARDVIHIYNSKRFGILIRFLGKEGTILDNPLIQRIHRNLRFIEDQWIVKYPPTEPRRRTSRQPTGKELKPELHAEIRDAIKRAQSHLKLQPKAKPKQVAEAIHDYLEGNRNAKKGVRNRDDLAIDLGALWGDALCNAARWEWQSVPIKGRAGLTSVVNANRSFAVNPFALMHGILKSIKTENNALLLFNMICARRMPEAAENSYTWLS